MATDSRPSARQRGYSTAWDKARAAYLDKHPLCVMCTERGRTTRATVVDHIKPHRGDMTLFWDSTNWQPLCAAHHNRDKQQQERRGYSTETGPDGFPVDPQHPFNRCPRGDSP